MEYLQKIDTVFEKQKEFFFTHKTKNIDFRLLQLKKLKEAIKKNEEKLTESLWEDLHKSKTEAYGTEIGLVMSDLSLHIKKLKKWAKRRQVQTSLVNFKSKSFIQPEPFGNVLIIAPWNYPFLLLIQPLVSAIAAGNVVMLKTSPYVPNIAKAMENMISEIFDDEYVSFFNGGRDVNQKLLEKPFDYIFFTGSPNLGHIVMEKASKHLTPVTLELGGKSPTIVDKDANIDIAARRIMWGKFINAGQTCVAPDYLFVHKEVKDDLLEKMVYYIKKFYGSDAEKSDEYPRIVNEKNVERLEYLISSAKIFYGGKIDKSQKYIEPTILVEVSEESAVMQEEIFGPILPVMEFIDIEKVINYVNKHPKPLAFYYFSESKQKQDYILKRTSSGGVCINDTLMHLASDVLPFGGVGNSGMGRYHGKFGFDTFSNLRSVLNKTTKIDVPVRYLPFKDYTLKIFKMLMK